MPPPPSHPDEEAANSGAPEEPDLTHRYLIQICFPDPDHQDAWEPVLSSPAPLDSLHLCSDLLESVKDLMNIPFGAELPVSFVKIRVWDSIDGRMILWEDDRGAVFGDDNVF